MRPCLSFPATSTASESPSRFALRSSPRRAAPPVLASLKSARLVFACRVAQLRYSILLAKIATEKAKPNRVFEITADKALDFLAPLPVKTLPGVGWRVAQLLTQMNLHTVLDIRNLTKSRCDCCWARNFAWLILMPRGGLRRLQQELGEKTGESLYSYARGIDKRKLEATKPRKSIGAEITWSALRLACPCLFLAM